MMSYRCPYTQLERIARQRRRLKKLLSPLPKPEPDENGKAAVLRLLDIALKGLSGPVVVEPEHHLVLVCRERETRTRGELMLMGDDALREALFSGPAVGAAEVEICEQRLKLTKGCSEKVFIVYNDGGGREYHAVYNFQWVSLGKPSAIPS